MQSSHPLRQALQRNTPFAHRVNARLIGRAAARRGAFRLASLEQD